MKISDFSSNKVGGRQTFQGVFKNGNQDAAPR